eukprot:10134481-Lingulodinium_polyedra.AAC.1
MGDAGVESSGQPRASAPTVDSSGSGQPRAASSEEPADVVMGEVVRYAGVLCYAEEQPLRAPTEPEPKFDKVYYDEDDGSALPDDL